MAANEIINGNNDMISPKAFATRAQAAVILYRLTEDPIKPRWFVSSR